jgi:drug/metabolite transporter (DMT)-like permease
MSRARVASVLAGLCFAGATALAAAAPAGAADYPNGGSVPTTVTVLGAPATAPAAKTDPGQSLPFTGGDVISLAGIGLGAVAVGAVMAGKGRRRSRTSA